MNEQPVGSENSPKLLWLQCVRAFAAIYVACYHASGDARDVYGATSAEFASSAFKFGNFGVELFFVISGFIIAHVHGADIGRPQRLINYVWKRLSRIYPLYWILFFSVVPLYFVFPDAGPDFRRQWENIFSCFFLFPLPPAQVIGVAWSLVYEMIFYILFGCAIVNRRVGLVIALLWPIGILLHSALMTDFGYYTNWIFSSRFMGFFVGMAVAWAIPLYGKRKPIALALPLTLVVFFLVPFVLDPGGGVQVLVRTVTYLAAGAVVLSAVHLDFASRHRAPRFFVRLGDATYSIYLYHWVIGWVLARTARHFGLQEHVPLALLLVTEIALMLSGAYVVHLLVERPILAWSRKMSPSARRQRLQPS
jgi:peptidoglycan/LPS O-acetylase OafA/YrhL